MHLLRTESRTLDEAEAAVDLDQTPADLVFLSFSDSDLAAVAAQIGGEAFSREADAASRDEKATRPKRKMSVRLASLASLKHPYSVDLYVEKAIAGSRFVLIRLLGGLDYWRYGVEEISRAARRHGVLLAIVPGDGRADPRLEEASTLPAADLREIFARFQSGGAANVGAALDWIEARLDGEAAWEASRAVAAAGVFETGARPPPGAFARALIIFYRSYLMAGDTAPVAALADALTAKGLDVEAVFVTSLKDGEASAFLRARIADAKPDVILNATAFSARLDDGASVLDAADAPVLQAIFCGASEAGWRADPRGLGAADLAMNVVLPEMDGRLIARAIAFKTEAPHRPELQFTPLVHEAAASRVKFVADLAAAWAHLRKTPPNARKIACVLSDYPGKAGRGGYAVGLDTARSAAAIAEMLRSEGYAIGPLPPADQLMARLEFGAVRAPEPRRLSGYVAHYAPHVRRGRRSSMGRARGRSRRAGRILFVRDFARRQFLSCAAARSRLGAGPQGAIPRRVAAAAPCLCRLLYLAAAGRKNRRHDPLRRAWDARMAAWQGLGAERKLRARDRAGADACRLSIHRQ